ALIEIRIVSPHDPDRTHPPPPAGAAAASVIGVGRKYPARRLVGPLVPDGQVHLQQADLLYLAPARENASRIAGREHVDVGVPFQSACEIGSLRDRRGGEQKLGSPGPLGEKRLYRIGVVGIGPDLAENVTARRVEK